MTTDSSGASTPTDVVPEAPSLMRNARFRGVAITISAAAMGVGGGRFVFIWLIGELTEWDTATAILGILIGIPPLALSAWAGGLADRLDPNRLGLGLLVISSVLFGATALLVQLDLMTVPLAMLCAFITAISPSMLMPLLQALVPAVVKRERLMQAVAYQNLAMNVSMITATMVCGAVIQLLGLAAGFWFLTATTALAALRYAATELPQLDRADDDDRSVRDGIRRVRRDPALRSLLMLTVVMGMMIGTTMLLLPELARDVLGRESFAAGALTGIMSVGVMISTVALATRWTPSRPGLVLVVVFCLSGGTGLILIGWSETYALTATISFFWGFCGGIVMTLLRTLTQMHAPPDLMGRVMGLATMALNGAAPVSAVLLVILTTFTSISGAMMISGVFYMGCIWLVSATTNIRKL